MATVLFDVEGMTCSACSVRIEKKLNRLEGVQATVSYAGEKAWVTLPPGMSPERISAEVRDAGYQAFPVDEAAEVSAPVTVAGARAWLPFAISAALSTPLMLPMALMAFGVHWHIPGWVQLALASATQFGPGLRFYTGAWHALRGGLANMDVLVALGTSTAWGLSLYELLARGDAESLYFESGAVIISLVLLGKRLEAAARDETRASFSELKNLDKQVCQRLAGVEPEAQAEAVAQSDLKSGDLVRVIAGDIVPVDGTVVSGRASVSEALLTGEANPSAKTAGDGVFAGTVNLDGVLTIRVTGTGAATRISSILRATTRAMGAKPAAQRMADTVAGIFVPVVLAIALVTLFGWLLAGAGAEKAIIAAISVLVIACPCALGLATPTAIMVAGAGALRAGLSFRELAALEKMRNLERIVFDKTGTVTTGRMRVTATHPAAGYTVAILNLAAGLERNVRHPLAAAICAAAEGPIPVATRFRNFPGQGVSGEIEGRDYLLGTAQWLKSELGLEISEPDRENALVHLGVAATDTYPAGYLGYFEISDEIAPGAARAIAALRALGLEAELLSGDRPAAANATARECGITRVTAGVSPEGKRAHIRELRDNGLRVAMVGDGINDAPALAEADVSFAMGDGSGVARECADITLGPDGVSLLPGAIQLARATARKIRQNLFFAFIYNAIGIPLAAFSLLNPMVAGAAMAASSVSVILSSLALRGTLKKIREKRL